MPNTAATAAAINTRFIAFIFAFLFAKARFEPSILTTPAGTKALGHELPKANPFLPLSLHPLLRLLILSGPSAMWLSALFAHNSTPLQPAKPESISRNTLHNTGLRKPATSGTPAA
jgi:hypothetical protein